MVIQPQTGQFGGGVDGADFVQRQASVEVVQDGDQAADDHGVTVALEIEAAPFDEGAVAVFPVVQEFNGVGKVFEGLGGYWGLL
jgi:hypothetical protein